jgi:hypothetical protein
VSEYEATLYADSIIKFGDGIGKLFLCAVMLGAVALLAGLSKSAPPPSGDKEGQDK